MSKKQPLPFFKIEGVLHPTTHILQNSSNDGLPFKQTPRRHLPASAAKCCSGCGRGKPLGLDNSMITEITTGNATTMVCLSCKDDHHMSDSPNYTSVMKQRWELSNSIIPEIDQFDIFNEHPFYKASTPPSKHQAHPEYTQSSYLRLRQLEEVFAIKNYLDPKNEKESAEMSITDRLKLFASSLNTKILSKPELISQYDRSYAIQKIFDLHMKKDYKTETLFLACAILDRFLYTIGWKTFPREKMCMLATISILMAAKLEQPISPSFTRMINLLTEDEQKTVSKKSLIALENDILSVLGFDFNAPGPIQSMERYLRILEYDLNRTVFDMSYQICKFQLNDSRFLDFCPSQMAACSIIVSVNIYERDVLRVKLKNQTEIVKGEANFFAHQLNIIQEQMRPEEDNRQLLKFNTEIWNNPRVVGLTGYSIEMLREPLYLLSLFIVENLSPNRLEGFDIEGIRVLRNYEPAPDYSQFK